MDEKIIKAFKKFDWNEIITKGNKLEDLNDRQWRFMKGLICELIVEKYSGKNGMKYVGEDHKDYDWPKFNISVELKSGLSGSMYNKKGRLRSEFKVKFNNSNGTNNKEKLDPKDVADILLVIKNDGAFIVDKQTVIDRSVKGGDGFSVNLKSSDIVEITGKVVVDNKDSLNFKKRIENAIKEVI
jgi:hypothetical protein